MLLTVQSYLLSFAKKPITIVILQRRLTKQNTVLDHNVTMYDSRKISSKVRRKMFLQSNCHQDWITSLTFFLLQTAVRMTRMRTSFCVMTAARAYR